MRLIELATILGVALAAGASPAAAQSDLAQFETQSGVCGEVEFALLGENRGYTYTARATPVYSNGGVAPQTVGEIPPITQLECHAALSDRVLVSKRGDGPKYCGWIDRDDLVAGKTVPQGAANPFRRSGDEVCGEIAPLNVSDLCARTSKSASEVAFEGCANEAVRKSPINAKFLTWNADLTNVERESRPVDVPLFAEPGAVPLLANPQDPASQKSVKIFQVYSIFDAKAAKDGYYLLIGANSSAILGWVRAGSGAVWYSKLATWFKPDGEGVVLNEAPSVPGATQIAKRPENAAEVLAGRTEKLKFPVLADNRVKPGRVPPDWKPYLDIAFIGQFCQDGNICVDTKGSRSIVPEDIRKADVLFLIDGTASMERYFGIVAKAVRDVTLSRNVVGNPDFRIGVSIYGDFNSASAMGLFDPMQYREAIRLAPMRDGDELDGLPSETLFLKDSAGGLLEAPNGALARAAGETRWRADTVPRFIIHIADHGDRTAAPQQLVDILQRERIFYIPVPVRGNFNKDANDAFVRQAGNVLARHKTAKGTPIGAPQVSVTYDVNDGATSALADYEAIAAALRAGVSLGESVISTISSEMLEGAAAPAGGGAEQGLGSIEQGYASLTRAAMEVFGIDSSASRELSLESRTVAARGYVTAAADSGNERDWNYFAIIGPSELEKLKGSFKALCQSITSSEAEDAFAGNIRDVIQVLSGDVFESNQQFLDYFADRNSIPLATRTVLGEGLVELARSIPVPERRKALQKEVCRSAFLLERMDGSQRVTRPFETRVANGGVIQGDLVWDDQSGAYAPQPDSGEGHDFTYLDLYGIRTIHLPLEYLPGAPTQIR